MRLPAAVRALGSSKSTQRAHCNARPHHRLVSVMPQRTSASKHLRLPCGRWWVQKCATPPLHALQVLLWGWAWRSRTQRRRGRRGTLWWVRSCKKVCGEGAQPQGGCREATWWWLRCDTKRPTSPHVGSSAGHKHIHTRVYTYTHTCIYIPKRTHMPSRSGRGGVHSGVALTGLAHAHMRRRCSRPCKGGRQT